MLTMTTADLHSLLLQQQCRCSLRNTLPAASRFPIRTIGVPQALKLNSFGSFEPRMRRSVKLTCVSAAAQQTTGKGKLVTKTEIPAFIPRQDLMDQLLRWASCSAEEPKGLGLWGLPVKVDPYYKDDEILWGVTFSIMRDGDVATQLGVWFDDEEVLKHEWVGRGADGFPTLEGKQNEVIGKHLEIRKLDDNEVDEVLRETIRNICQQLVSAINKYYAFGSVFVDEAT